MASSKVEMTIRRWYALLLAICLSADGLDAAEPQRSHSIRGKYLNLLPLSPQLTRLRKSSLTVEFWIRPDAACIRRDRCLLYLMSNRAGSDINACSVAMHQGRVNATVFATYLKAKVALKANQWTHIALTLNSDTINKRARLWINGQRVAQALILKKWPPSFYYVGMFGDPWLNTRVFTGQTGGVRLSKKVRYRQPFTPVAPFKRDKATVVLSQP